MRDVLGAGWSCLPATARLGALHLHRGGLCDRRPPALDALAEAGTGFDGVLLACFGDPGLFA